jgi:DNA polymerase III epsilon subunit-like protein
MRDKILFVDTETGGLEPTKHSLLSIGLAVWCNFEIVDCLEILINDGRLNANEKALAINKIDIDLHKRVAKPSSEAFYQLKVFLQKHFNRAEKITLAGHNVSFDVSFLKEFLNENNENYSDYFSHRLIDTSSILYYLYLAGKIDQRAISSDEAFKAFKINVLERHTALKDALATAELFTKLLFLTKRKNRGEFRHEMWSEQYALF